MRRLLALLCLLGGPALAQEADLRFSPEATEACLATAQGNARLDCVGLSAAACIEATPDGYTTVGMGICLGREWDYWDARLNAAYAAVMSKAGEIDAELKALGSAAPPQAPALRAMQRTWIAFRDAACDFERTTWGGGTGQGPAGAECLMRQTALQAITLEDRLATY